MGQTLVSQLESILFVASKPLSLKQLMNALEVSEEKIYEALGVLKEKYAQEKSGIILLEHGEEWHMVSNPDNHAVAEKFLKAEVSGELTRPQLETLTVVSYCGPLSKAELEQIRGVNCSVILRNLMMRGLVKETEETTELLPRYEVTMDYIRYMGIERVEDLPNYTELHNHDYVARVLETQPTV